jgi:hypothetical protein
MSELIIIAGGTGQGKTRFVNGMIKNTLLKDARGKDCYRPSGASRHQYIFDLNNEYIMPTEAAPAPYMRHTQANQKLFVETCKKLTGYTIVFEDASGFLRGKQAAELIRLIVQRRHNRNNWIILFHSINRIPPELMEYCNTFILFKTNDNLKDIDKKFKSQVINTMFYKLQNAKNHSYLINKML